METGQQEEMTYPAEQGLLWSNLLHWEQRHSLILPLSKEAPFQHLQFWQKILICDQQRVRGG